MAEPPITLRAVHTSAGTNLPPTRYVVHATAGGRGYPKESAKGVARATARYFQQQSSGGSAHYIHDAGGLATEEHCVPESTIAWHAPPNPRSVGDEICADPDYTREQWLSDEVWPAVRASALRCREVCDRTGIPKIKLSPADLRAGKHGICGHVDVSNAFHQSSHWDPGPAFPWDRYMAVVNGEEDDMDLKELEDFRPDRGQNLWDALKQIQTNQANTSKDLWTTLGRMETKIQAIASPDQLAAKLAPAIAAAVQDADQGATVEVVEQALRNVLSQAAKPPAATN